MATRSYLSNVLGLAHEVRVCLRDEGVVVATVLPGASPRDAAFRILPWGTTSVMTVQLEQILRAAPVRHMTWSEQRRICASQGAGVFARVWPGQRRAARFAPINP
jgi:hypothetical protein